MSLDDIDIEHWLMLHDYKNVEEWALQAGYTYHKDRDIWEMDAMYVNIEDELRRLLEEEMKSYE